MPVSNAPDRYSAVCTSLTTCPSAHASTSTNWGSKTSWKIGNTTKENTRGAGKTQYTTPGIRLNLQACEHGKTAIALTINGHAFALTAQARAMSAAALGRGLYMSDPAETINAQDLKFEQGGPNEVVTYILRVSCAS